MKDWPDASSLTPSRAVLTLAVGKPIYLEMAANLARSFRVWHHDSEIEFHIATDHREQLPSDLDFVRVMELQSGQFGHGFSPKLHLDKLAPSEETIFIDADCLCVGPLDAIFDRFYGRQVSVVGREESEGDLFGDIATRCRLAGVDTVPRFCGGLYYIRKGAVATRVFEAARDFQKRYEELGLIPLRGMANEEPLIGLGMAVNAQHPIPEDGTIKAEPMFFSGQTEIDVFAGRARLFNLPSRTKPYSDWQIPAEARPIIVHFNASFAEQPPYTIEAKRLKKVLADNWPLSVATAYTTVSKRIPFVISQGFKAAFRPFYRAVFGVRAVKPSKRVLEPTLSP